MSLAVARSESFGVISALVIDDNAFDRRRLKKVASQTWLRMTVRETSDVAQFRRALNHAKYDVIYVDLNLTGANGMELLSDIRCHPENHHAAVIMIAGNNRTEVALDAIRNGFADYIEKDKLSAASLERATVNAMQKGQLEKQTTNARDQARTFEDMILQVSEACSEEMRPIVTKLMGQVRQLRKSTIEDPNQSADLKTIEKSCARLENFLSGLEKLVHSQKKVGSKRAHTPVETLYRMSKDGVETVTPFKGKGKKPKKPSVFGKDLH